MIAELKERRNQIERLYHRLEMVRALMKALIIDNLENLTSDNIHILEMEEERIISRIIRLKTILHHA